ncbi:hypothetical protein Nmel_004331 [Mimus melanotis]
MQNTSTLQYILTTKLVEVQLHLERALGRTVLVFVANLDTMEANYCKIHPMAAAFAFAHANLLVPALPGLHCLCASEEAALNKGGTRQEAVKDLWRSGVPAKQSQLQSQRQLQAWHSNRFGQREEMFLHGLALSPVAQNLGWTNRTFQCNFEGRH